MSRWLFTVSMMGTPQSHWAPCASASLPSSKRTFPEVQRAPPVFQFVPIAPCSVTRHLWKESASFQHPPSKYLCPMIRSHSKPSLLWLNSHQLNPFTTLVAFGWILHYFHVSLALRCPELSLDPALQAWPHQCWAEGKGHIPWSVSSNAVIAARANSWLVFNLVSHQDPQILFCQDAS